MPTSNKIEKLIDSQKEQNEFSGMMKHYYLKLKNSMFFPQHNTNLNFTSSTASSVAKKTRILSPNSKHSLSIYKSRKSTLYKKTKAEGFRSHYDKLKRERTKSIIKNDPKKQKHNSHNTKTLKKVKPAIVSSKRKCTVPQEFSFATKHLVRKKRTRNTQTIPKSIKQKHEPNQKQKKKPKIVIKRSKYSSSFALPTKSSVQKRPTTTKNKINTNNVTSNLNHRKLSNTVVQRSKRSLSFALPTKTSISRTSTKYTNNQQKKSVINHSNVTKHVRQKMNRAKSKKVRSLSKTFSEHTLKKHATSNKKQVLASHKNKKSNNNKKNKLSTTINTSYHKDQLQSFIFDESEFRKIKKKLRKGISINTNKTRRQSNIQSAYAQKSPTVKRNSLLITPIGSKNNSLVSSKSSNHGTNIEDLAIDEILTEDVYTIGTSITPSTIAMIRDIVSPRKKSRDDMISTLKSPILTPQLSSCIYTINEDSTLAIQKSSIKEDYTQSTSRGMSPVQLVTTKNSFIEELMFKDKKALEDCNKEIENKFDKLDNFFNHLLPDSYT